MSFQVFCVLLGSCLVASVYGADVDATTEGRDSKCFSCLLKCAFKIPHMKEFALCLADCVNPLNAGHLRDGRLRIQSSNPGPCHRIVPIGGGRGRKPGQYDGPQCDADGNFLPLQFNPSTGYSWCVDKDGLEVPDTYTPPGHPAPNCGENVKVATVENGGECVSCAFDCVASSKCESIFSLKCWGCVFECLGPMKSEKIQESESVEEEEDDASGEPSNTGEPWVTLFKPTTTKPKPPPDSSEEQVEPEKSEDSAEFTHPPTPVTFITGKKDSSMATFLIPTTTKPKPPPESSEEQGEQEKSEDSAEFTHPPTHVTFKPVVEPIIATKPAEPAESSAELSEPQQDQDDY